MEVSRPCYVSMSLWMSLSVLFFSQQSFKCPFPGVKLQKCEPKMPRVLAFIYVLRFLFNFYLFIWVCQVSVLSFFSVLHKRRQHSKFIYFYFFVVARDQGGSRCTVCILKYYALWRSLPDPWNTMLMMSFEATSVITVNSSLTQCTLSLGKQ